MTFLEIKHRVFDRIQVSRTQTGTLNDTIGGFVNQWHRKILVQPVFDGFRKTQVTLATVADQWRYGTKLLKIDHITERTNDRRLIKKTESWWRKNYPDPTEGTGDSEYWIPLGQTRIKQRPANASELFAISSSASDTNTISVEVVRSNGEVSLLSLPMTGATAVSLSSFITDVVDVLDVYLSAVAVGTVTLREDSGVGTVLSEIAIGESKPRYTQLVLVPTPSSALTYFLDGTARMTDLVDDFDEPLIYEDFHDILIDGAVYEYWLSHGRTKEAQWLRDEIEKFTQRMRGWAYWEFEQDETDMEQEAFNPLDRLTLPLT
ncbi:hypothetical protein LCGC14_0609770 [marine sediment metagenome]|uniref:Uncharacterized protein n=1 Tax=marine sediment metagenome TaxID=412755 RepID=A0A0F9TU91_9ZZZZ